MAARSLTSLRDALKLAMEGPGSHRVVFVTSVHVCHAAALLAFLKFEVHRGRWEVRNAARLASLVSIDGLLRALATDLLPRLVEDPTSEPALNLLCRYARFIMASASAAGGTFARDATAVCTYIIDCTDDPAFGFLLLTVMVPDDIHLTTLRQALQEATDAPAADRRVLVDTVRASHSFALLGVVEFQATACSWNARNLGRLRAVTTIAGCLETLGLGLLRVLLDDPNRRAALTILADFAGYTKEKVAKVGGDFAEDATRFCNNLIAHGATAKRRALRVPTLVMRMRAEKIRQELAVFTSRALSIAVDSGSDTVSTSSSDTVSTSSSNTFD